MIGQVGYAMVQMMLVKFMLNDVPHALDIPDGRPHHGRIINVDKYNLSPEFTSYVVEYADGYREGQVKVYDPLVMKKLVNMLSSLGVHYTSDRLKSPPEPRGVKGFLVKFNFSDVAGNMPALGWGEGG